MVLFFDETYFNILQYIYIIYKYNKLCEKRKNY